MAESQQQTESQQTTAPAQEPAPQKEAGFFVSKEEWTDFRREIRNKLLTKDTAPVTPPESGKANGSGDYAALAAQFDQLKSERAFEKAVIRSGLQFSSDQLGLLESAFAHQKPAHEQLGDWMQRTATAMGVKPAGQQVAPQIPDPPRNKATDNSTGTPARTPEGTTKDPRVFARENPEAWKRLPDQERSKWMSDWERQNGGGQGALVPAHLRLANP